jgi:hypothetical protein
MVDTHLSVGPDARIASAVNLTGAKSTQAMAASAIISFASSGDDHHETVISLGRNGSTIDRALAGRTAFILFGPKFVSPEHNTIKK